jgi:protein AATF/BFR2
MLANKPSRDAADHTKAATQVWRDCASLRIALQGALQEVHTAGFQSSSDNEDMSKLDELICDLLKSSAKRLRCGASPASIGRSWDAVSKHNDAIMTYCLKISDSWHEQTKGPNRKNLKALDQSISSQMEYVMNDPDSRAVKRCRGLTEGEYDDAPLYAALLKESVQKGASGDEFRAMKLASKFGKKPSAKEVDRRASKGRKIRYSMIDKLVNFMAPRPVPVSEGTPITNEELVNAFVNSVFH